MDCMCILRVEEVMYSAGDTVNLREGSDAEQTYAYA